MMSFEDKLKAVLSIIEKENDSSCEYKVYNGRKDALSIFNEAELDTEESSALLTILANVSSEEKITLVSVKSNYDEDYEVEYQEAELHHSCALFSYEDMERGKLSLFGEEISGLTIYCGWMMKPEM